MVRLTFTYGIGSANNMLRAILSYGYISPPITLPLVTHFHQLGSYYPYHHRLRVTTQHTRYPHIITFHLLCYPPRFSLWLSCLYRHVLREASQLLIIWMWVGTGCGSG